ncbi:hypothetical protein SKAU_G00410090 [Synaphobranchus kaupii]|uniref:Alpha-ketoglutarate-dependent dioxygenase FTO catalytic domain-containing protein n=1 Tax=Synaphobranchus kaupii TaxID=118154 RepID=A0A9Q1IAV1_SYNKA|nr:hypothetical protein SKAU_G00410090 [Synaphobranchus kaupii]
MCRVALAVGVRHARSMTHHALSVETPRPARAQALLFAQVQGPIHFLILPEALENERQKLLQELGGQHIPFLSPSDPGYQQLWESSYCGLALRPADSLPANLHERVRAALHALQSRGCLFRDLVRIRGRDVFTVVSRSLLGRPGDTYRYLGTRLFALPWHREDQGNVEACCDHDLREACRALWELNEYFREDVVRVEAGGPPGGRRGPAGRPGELQPGHV